VRGSHAQSHFASSTHASKHGTIAKTAVMVLYVHKLSYTSVTYAAYRGQPTKFSHMQQAAQLHQMRVLDVARLQSISLTS
jgi:hypothetical protein